MSAELVAIGLQIAFTAFSALAFILFYKKEKKEITEKLNIEVLKTEVSELIDEKFDIETLKTDFIGIIDERFNIDQLKLEFTELINIEQLKIEFTEIVDERLQSAIDQIGEAFSGIMTDPTVKKAFSIIGSQGGEAKSQNQAVDSMAADLINGPQFAAIKMGAEAMGLDVESYIEKHGAMKTLQAAQQLANFAGIDLLNLGNLSLPGGTGGSRHNPYLRR